MGMKLIILGKDDVAENCANFKISPPPRPSFSSAPVYIVLDDRLTCDYLDSGLGMQYLGLLIENIFI